MSIVALAGASGVVGSRVLEELLAREDVARVVALGRRPLTRSHPKLDSHVVDLLDAEAVSGALPEGIDVALCCLGTTMKRAGSREAFRAVDRDAVVAFARGARVRGARRFALVSSAGASPEGSTFYLRVKGEAEAAVVALGFDGVTVLRPSLLDDRGARSEFRVGERLALPVARLVFSIVGKTSRYAPIPVDAVARAMVRLALDGSEAPLRVVESGELHVLGR